MTEPDDPDEHLDTLDYPACFVCGVPTRWRYCSDVCRDAADVAAALDPASTCGERLFGGLLTVEVDGRMQSMSQLHFNTSYRAYKNVMARKIRGGRHVRHVLHYDTAQGHVVVQWDPPETR